jgi:hypothetical protein
LKDRGAESIIANEADIQVVLASLRLPSLRFSLLSSSQCGLMMLSPCCHAAEMKHALGLAVIWGLCALALPTEEERRICHTVSAFVLTFSGMLRRLASESRKTEEVGWSFPLRTSTRSPIGGYGAGCLACSGI